MNKLVVISAEKLEELIKTTIKDELERSEINFKSEKEEILTNRQAMDYLHVSRSTLQRWRKEGKLPYHKINGKIFYTISDIKKSLNKAQK